jgi:hypothetical protein
MTPQLFETYIELDEEAWEKFQTEVVNAPDSDFFPPERLQELRDRAKELKMKVNF